MKAKWIRFGPCIAAAAVLALLVACAAPLGTLQFSADMSQAFREGRPPLDWRYYATGRGRVPDAIVGLDPEWRQTARHWREIDPESEDLLRLIRSVKRYNRREPRASDIVTPDGKVIGVYWSSLFWTTVEMGKGNTVSVFRPRLPPTREW